MAVWNMELICALVCQYASNKNYLIVSVVIVVTLFLWLSGRGFALAVQKVGGSILKEHTY